MYFLGLKIARNKSGIHLNQRKHTLHILSNTCLLGCKPALKPMSCDTRLTNTNDTHMSDPTKYHRLVGHLIYLLNIRLDISYFVQQLIQHMSNPIDVHYDTVRRVLSYLKSSPVCGLFFPSTSIIQLKAFSDSDLETCPETREFITGFCIYMGDCLISWKSKKQATVSRSSTEAEYRSMASIVCELHWLTNLLQEINVPFQKLVLLYFDNASVIHIANNSSFYE